MKLVFGPDTSDHPNWGCRVMGAWFKRALAREGLPPSWLAPSAWFIRPHPSLPRLDSMADIVRHAREVREGRILPDIAAMLRQCDAVLLNGENFVRPGAYKGRMLLFVAFLVKQVFRKPCLLTHHTVELGDPALEEMVREIYPTLDEVNFREETSAELCAGWLPPGRSRMIPDVAFAVPPAPREAWSGLGARGEHFSTWPDSAEGFDPRRPYVTVCASSIYQMPQHAKRDPVPGFVRLCERLHRELAPVLLAAPCDIDLRILRQVQARTGLPLLGLTLPVRQAVDVIGNAAVHVGGRWHPGIFAASGGTPSVYLSSNSHKVSNLARLMGLGDPVFNALDLEAQVDAIVAQAGAHLEAGPALRDRILVRSRELASQVDGHLDGLRALGALHTPRMGN